MLRSGNVDHDLALAHHPATLYWLIW